jgi:chemotaxis protein methyltransferase CheR
MRETEYEFIRSLVYEHSRINLGTEKRELVAARLGKRLRATRLATVGEYCNLLRGGHGEELGHLIDAISTNHTFFFRETPHFDFLRDRLLPEFLAQPRAARGPVFRAWSAACSSGEEPYSFAIALAEALGPGCPWRIEGTDISRRILDRARAATYPEEVVARLAPAHARDYFQRGTGPQDGGFRVKPALTAHIGFHHLNLLQGKPPFTEPFHLIICRNVMIYFDRPTQEELVNRLARWLRPGGYLFVGHSESLGAIRHPLKSVCPAVYRRETHP